MRQKVCNSENENYRIPVIERKNISIIVAMKTTQWADSIMSSQGDMLKFIQYLQIICICEKNSFSTSPAPCL